MSSGTSAMKGEGQAGKGKASTPDSLHGRSAERNSQGVRPLPWHGGIHRHSRACATCKVSCNLRVLHMFPALRDCGASDLLLHVRAQDEASSVRCVEPRQHARPHFYSPVGADAIGPNSDSPNSSLYYRTRLHSPVSMSQYCAVAGCSPKPAT